MAAENITVRFESDFAYLVNTERFRVTDKNYFAQNLLNFLCEIVPLPLRERFNCCHSPPAWTREAIVVYVYLAYVVSQGKIIINFHSIEPLRQRTKNGWMKRVRVQTSVNDIIILI